MRLNRRLRRRSELRHCLGPLLHRMVKFDFSIRRGLTTALTCEEQPCADEHQRHGNGTQQPQCRVSNGGADGNCLQRVLSGFLLQVARKTEGLLADVTLDLALDVVWREPCLYLGCRIAELVTKFFNGGSKGRARTLGLHLEFLD